MKNKVKNLKAKRISKEKRKLTLKIKIKIKIKN
jgi:hypothetical protein